MEYNSSRFAPSWRMVLLIRGPGQACLAAKWVHCTGCHENLGFLEENKMAELRRVDQ